MEGSVIGLDINQNTHVNNSYVISVRCSRFEERKKCAREHERAQVAEVDVRKRDHRMEDIPYFIAMLSWIPSWFLRGFPRSVILKQNALSKVLIRIKKDEG